MSTEQKKEGFLKNLINLTPEPVKKIAKKITLGVALLFASNTASASPTGSASPDSPDAVKTYMKVPNIASNSQSTIQLDSIALNLKSFHAYSGETYNSECNGSICWIASASRETWGKKNSMAAWGEGRNKYGKIVEYYRGINQMSTYHTKRFVKYINTCANLSVEEFKRTFDLKNSSEESIVAIQNEAKTVYNKLSRGGIGKKNWQTVANQHEHVMTLLNQGYLTQEYNPKYFKDLQEMLISSKDSVKFDLSKVHPAILSEIHMLTVARPGWYKNIAKKIKTTIKGKDNPYAAINSESFIEELAKLEKTKDVRNRMISYTKKAFTDPDIKWNECEFRHILAGAKATFASAETTNFDNKTWFDIQRDEIAQAKAKKMLEEAVKNAPKTFSSGAQQDYTVQVDAVELATLNQTLQKNKEEQKIQLLKQKRGKYRTQEIMAQARRKIKTPNLTLAEVKKAKERTRAALDREKAIANAQQNQEPQIDNNTPTEDNIIAMIQKDLTTKNGKKLKGRDARQARRNLERFNNDEAYRYAVIQAYMDKLSKQSKA